MTEHRFGPAARVLRGFGLAAVLMSTTVHAQAPAGPPAMPVEATPVKVDTVVITATAVGSLQANESVILRPEIDGRVQAIHFEEGQAVEKGGLLITLDPEERRALVAESTASAEVARLNFERIKELHGKKLASPKEYDEARARLDEAVARRTLNQVQLAKTVLRAPFAGVLGLRQVSPGDYVEKGQDLVNLESLDPIKLDAQLPETYARSLKPAQSIRITVDAYPGETFNGEIYALDPRLDPATRTLTTRSRIPNVDGRLRPGMFARVSVVLEQHPNAILVPEEALVPRGDKQFVYRIVDGKVLLSPVQIGQRRPGEVEITQGLSADDTVVTAGQMKLRDGAAVTVIGGPAAARTGGSSP